MNANALEVIRYIGIINSLFLAIRMVSDKKRSGTVYFAVLIIILAINIAFLSSLSEGFLRGFPEFIILVDWFPFAYAPLFYLFIRHSLKFHTPKIELSQDYIHFVPAVLNTLYLILFYIVIGRQNFTEMVVQIQRGIYPWFFFLSMGIKVAAALIYFGAIFLLLYRNRQVLVICSENKMRRNWFVASVICFILCFLSPIIGIVFLPGPTYEFAALIFMVIVINITVFFAMRNPGIFSDMQLVKKIRQQFYQSDSHKNDLQKQIISLFKVRRIHLNEELKMRNIADLLGITVNQISFYINDIFNMNANELINSYRLEEFMSLLEDEADSNILELALRSGFNSKTSFNRIFKAKYHMSPTEYKKMQE